MASTDEPTQKPSQAEGERGGNDQNTPTLPENDTEPAAKPSQAEGDRSTIESDIRDKEQRGEL